MGLDCVVFPVEIIQLYLDKIHFRVFRQNLVQHVGGIVEGKTDMLYKSGLFLPGKELKDVGIFCCLAAVSAHIMN